MLISFITRIPSLSAITNEDVDFDEELKAQGLANILAGALGAPHNYLTYSNSIFYFILGGRGTFSKLAITVLTAAFFFIGPTILQFIPRIVAGYYNLIS
jgi:SulP family sulfate permease